MVAGLLKMADLEWAVPDYTTLCRRQKTLAVQIPCQRAEGPLNLLVDTTGTKFHGDGECRLLRATLLFARHVKTHSSNGVFPSKTTNYWP